MKPINGIVYVSVIDYRPSQEVTPGSDSRSDVFRQGTRETGLTLTNRQFQVLFHFRKLITIVRLAVAVQVLPDCPTTMTQRDNKRRYGVTMNIHSERQSAQDHGFRE